MKSHIRYLVPLVLLLSVTVSSCRREKGEDFIYLKENCVEFDPTGLTIQDLGTPTLVFNGQEIKRFANQEEAEQGLAVIQQYGMNKQCTCGQGEHIDTDGAELDPEVMYYYLVDNKAPVGEFEGEDEDCLSFDPDRTFAKRVGGDWVIIEKFLVGGHLMFNFGNDRASCNDAIRAIKKYGFDKTCFVGRPMPSMSYLRGPGTAPEPIEPTILTH
jgi:hypothetical protein